ncbi:MAG: hypothetical protein NT016_02750 [Candidatus Aenigmarchaeota archaeon]|nr:hypothetical protein [Candidatus Aenigmarchaeota archaeon]
MDVASGESSMGVKRKGARMFAEGKVKKDMEAERRSYFNVQGETELHSVVFDKTRNEWSCDCKFSSMKARECSHIYACKLHEKNETRP